MGREREITSIYLSLHCHHQNDSCMKMGSDESHVNASLIVRDKVKRQCPQTTTFEEKGEPKPIRTEVLPITSLPTALPLGQTGSHMEVGGKEIIYLPLHCHHHSSGAV